MTTTTSSEADDMSDGETTTFTRLAGGFADGAELAGGETRELIDPATGEAWASAGMLDAAAVDDAVRAARRAFDTGPWPRMSPAERCEAIERLAALVEQHAEELATLESRNTGKPLKVTSMLEIPGTAAGCRFFAQAGRHLEGRASAEYSPEHTSTIRREPVGVVATIAPWNYPLMTLAWKVAPALATGNCVVFKPSELTPATALRVAQLGIEAGLPPGVLNVVCGEGASVGRALTRHPQVDVVAFTGSTATGRAVMADAAATTKRVQLELGGKAPMVVFDDANVLAAAEAAIIGGYLNSGQNCAAITRIYVQRPRCQEFLDALAPRVAQLTLGGPADEADLGPLIGEQHLRKVEQMVDRALADGARALVGGARVERPGCFYAPTLLVGAAQDSEIVQEEVFGPVLCVLPFDGDDEGIALANDTPYGLAAAAWTHDVFRAQRAARELRAGMVFLNDCGGTLYEMPFGGVRGSGFGKDLSLYALDEYTVVKHVMAELTDVARKPWYELVSRPLERA